MAYNGANPADDEYISAGPGVIRENQRAMKDDGIVNAGTLGGRAPGNASGDIPIANGVKCVNLDADKLDGKDATEFAGLGHGHNVATTNADGFMSNTMVQKLAGIQSGAQVNQNVFQGMNAVDGVTGVTITPSSPTDILNLVRGANIAIVASQEGKSLTFSVVGTVPYATNATSAGAASTAYWLIDAMNNFYNPASFALAGHTTHSGESVSTSAAGYVKMANGIIIQWKSATISAGSGTSFNWPLTFPNACLGFSIGHVTQAVKPVSVTSYQTTGYTAVNPNTDTQTIFVIGIGY